MAVGYIPFVFPGVPNVHCAFQTRYGGQSEGAFAGSNISYDVGDTPEAVAANRADLMERLGIDTWAELKQVHGDTTVTDPADTGTDQAGSVEADGSVTDKHGLALVVKTADCQPILLAHRSGKYVGALHAGWRGNAIGYPATGVHQFCAAYAIKPEDVFAVRGPSLGPAAAEFTNFESEWNTSFSPWFDARKRTMNLWALTRHQLKEAGVPDNQIFGIDLCTWSLQDMFYSYRGARTTGRQASLIWIER